MTYDDERLVKQVLAGDDNAFACIVERYKAYVFAIILNICQDKFEAENIAQEVFLQVYRSLHQFRSQKLKAWIGKITVRKAVDNHRKNLKYSRDGHFMAYPDFLTLSVVYENADQERADPEEVVLQKEQRQRIRTICQRLPKIYRRVVEKHYFEGKSYREIAAEEGITPKTVESRLYRARYLFREKWREGDL